MIKTIINTITKIIFSVGIFDIRDKARQTEILVRQAQVFAANRKLQSAINDAQKAIELWNEQPNFWERLFRDWFLNIDLSNLSRDLRLWNKNFYKASHHIKQGLGLLNTLSDHPREAEKLSKIIQHLEQAQLWLLDATAEKYLLQLRPDFEKRNQWNQKVLEAQSLSEQKYFIYASQIYRQAYQDYNCEQVKQQLDYCLKYQKQEEWYLTKINDAQEFCRMGNFHKAHKILKSTLARFSRIDGQKFYNKVLNVLRAKRSFLEGLRHEQKQNFSQAIQFYANAQEYITNDEYQLRQAICAYKQTRYQLSEELIQGLTSERASYFRGLILIKKDQYRLAQLAWESIQSFDILEQKKKLEKLLQISYLIELQKIENCVEEGDLEQAVTLSQKAITNFAETDIIQKNLTQNIIPRQAREGWEAIDPDWHNLRQKAQSNFSQNANIKTLHNWAVACYYCLVNEAQPDYKLLLEFNATWSMAIFNLTQNPNLKNVLWFEGKSINYQKIKEKLEELWDTALENVKNNDIDSYLKIRDWQRLDLYTLKELSFPVAKGFNFYGLWLSPSSKYYLNILLFLTRNGDPVVSYDLSSNSKIPIFYTELGRCIAAFLDGDNERALSLKASTIQSLGQSPDELSAKTWAVYFEGCYHLKNKRWRDAFTQFSLERTAIYGNKKWSDEIDNLCEQTSKNLEGESRKEFINKWYNLAKTQISKRYWVEISVDDIRQDLTKDRISFHSAKSKLEKLRSLDPNNAVIKELIYIIEKQEITDEIQRYFQRGDLEGAVNYTLRCSHEDIRQMVAKILVDIFQNHQHQFTPYDVIKLRSWVEKLLG